MSMKLLLKHLLQGVLTQKRIRSLICPKPVVMTLLFIELLFRGLKYKWVMKRNELTVLNHGKE